MSIIHISSMSSRVTQPTSSLRMPTRINLCLNSHRREVVVEVFLLRHLTLFIQLGLHYCCLDGLFLGLFDHSLHPMIVIRAWLTIHVFEFFLDVRPDLAVLEVRVQLDYLHVLLLFEGELMQVEPNSVETTEDYLAKVELLNALREHFCDVTFILLALFFHCVGSNHSLLQSAGHF